MRAFLILAILLTVTLCVAQEPYLYFSKISTDKGLSHNKVNCILQDKRGFIWFGTEDGLNRYDGQYFTIFRNVPNDTTTISGNIITDLLEDEDSVIWIATSDGGLTKYDYRLSAGKQFKQFKHIAGDVSTIPVNIINKIVEDDKGYLWLATSGAYVLRFDRKKETFESPVKRGTRSVASLLINEDGNLWAGKIGGSFLKINTTTLSYEMDERYENLYDVKLPHATITSLFRDDENNIWFGSWDNVLYRYNAKTKAEESFKKNENVFSFPNDEVSSLAEDKHHRIWMAGKYFGLTIYDKAQKKFFNYRYNSAKEGGIADDHINCVYIDKYGMVWLGTNKGVSVYNPSQQPFIQTFLPSQNKDVTIYDFYTDEHNRLWLGTSEGIFIQSQDGKFELKKLFYKGIQLAVSKFFKDIDGTFYLGTQYSLFVYHIAKNKVELLPNTEKDSVMKKIINSRVVSLMRDTIAGNPVLLVSPYGHYITYYDLVQKQWTSRVDSVKKIVTRFNLKDNLIRKFYRSSDGHIWLATAKYGLGDWQQHTTPLINHLCNNPKVGKTISNDNVYDILEGNNGNLWVSTYGGGLNYFIRSKQIFEHVYSSNNLLEGIEADKHGNIWMISNGNIHKYDLNSRSYSTYVLPDLEKKGGAKGYIFKDTEGFFYVAGINYYIKFNPLQVKEINDAPKVYFTDFKILTSSYPDLLQKKNIELRYFQNYFSLEFSAPEFITGATQYSYMLQGIDKDWIDAGNHNFANYSNLPGGKYVFKVRAGSTKSDWAKEISSITITIIPPFWKQGWFYLLCALVIAVAVYFFYLYRINELLKRQAIRNKIAQDLHDNMGSTLSSISVYSQVAKIYHQQQKEEQLHETLEKIGETSGEMIAEMGDIVWAINPRNDHMSTIIQRMESYAKPLLHAKNIAFQFNYDRSIPSLNLQMDKRKNFYLIFKEAVNNVLKYASCKTLNINIRAHNQHVELTIKDDGKGFDLSNISAVTSKSLSGNGLKKYDDEGKGNESIFENR
jgi:ligand-binding sensor domain-containing protein